VVTFLVLTGVVVASVWLHRLAIEYLHWRVRRKRTRGTPVHPRHQVASVLVLVIAHALEIALFAVGMLAAIHAGGGGVSGMDQSDYVGLFYFSFAVYSSLGFGDLLPTGALRLYCGVQVIVGLLLIAWSATALFTEVFLHASPSDSTGQGQKRHR